VASRSYGKWMARMGVWERARRVNPLVWDSLLAALQLTGHVVGGSWLERPWAMPAARLCFWRRASRAPGAGCGLKPVLLRMRGSVDGLGEE
jgi:hypothetical protein